MVNVPAQRDPDDEPKSSFGAELRRLRLARGWTLTRLAREAHYSHGQLSKIETGAKVATRELAEACDVALEADGELAGLVGRREPRRPRSGMIRSVDLPPATAVFIGREAELAAVVDRLAPARTRGPRLVVVYGPPGSGKTQLVIHAATRLLDHYPDGCLFLDFDAIGDVPDAFEAMGRLLRRIGLSADVIPADAVERAAVYRATTRDRKLLLVLDNPPTAHDVQVLLPAGNAAGVLVSARRPLRALDEAADLRLRPLDVNDARDLFVRIAKLPSPDADPETSALVDRATAACGHLPLPVRVAAARLRPPTQLSLADLVGQLQQPDETLAALDDGGRNVARVFADACAALPPDQGRLFALLSLHPAETIDVWTATLLLENTRATSAHLLAGLAEASLLDPADVGRWTIHHLTRAASGLQASAILPVPELDQARLRLITGYVCTAQQADVAVTPTRHREPQVLPPGNAPESGFRSREEAIRWLDTHQDALTRLVDLAADQRLFDLCWTLAYALRDHFFRMMALRSWIRTHSVALDAARQTRDKWAIAVTSSNLGLAYALADDLDVADQHYADALALFRELQDPYGEANTLGHFAWTAYRRGQFLKAVTQAQAALDIYRRRNAPRNIAITLRTLALAEAANGDVQSAIAHLDEALPLCVSQDLPVDEAMTLNCLGELTAHAAGHDKTVVDLHVRAWWRARVAASASEQARALRGMAGICAAAGRIASAERLRAHAARLQPAHDAALQPQRGGLDRRDATTTRKGVGPGNSTFTNPSA